MKLVIEDVKKYGTLESDRAVIHGNSPTWLINKVKINALIHLLPTHECVQHYKLDLTVVNKHKQEHKLKGKIYKLIQH